MKNRFQSSPFKCNLQRYTVYAGAEEEEGSSHVALRGVLDPAGDGATPVLPGTATLTEDEAQAKAEAGAGLRLSPLRRFR